MNQVPNVFIPIDVPKDEFSEFLSIDNNRRIFFSGKYGIGKTLFLKKFFEANRKYDTYHLYPIRYQITSNENIVELLKYDILVELLKKYPDAFQGENINGVKDWVEIFYAFVREKASANGVLRSVITTGENALAIAPDPILQILGKLGRPLKELLKLDKEFQKFKGEYIERDNKVIEMFYKKIESMEGIVDTDYISHLLRLKINELKTETKKSVLILDDFDRIDPEHVFRILNVLSVHMDDDDENKFGFDRIVIVGDVQNLRSIYRHKYGALAEFWGYFDKYFTIRPFQFGNKAAIATRIPELLLQIKHGDPGLKNVIGQSSGIINFILYEVLSRAFENGMMNLRQLYKPVKYSFPEVRFGVYPFEFTKELDHAVKLNHAVHISIKLLIALLGDREHLLEVLKNTKKSLPDIDSDKTANNSNQQYAIAARPMIKFLLPLPLKPGDTVWLDKYRLMIRENYESGLWIYPEVTQSKAQYFYDVLIEFIEKVKIDDLTSEK